MFRSMSLKTKLMLPIIALSVVLCFLTVFVGWRGFSGLTKVNHIYNHLTADLVPDEARAYQMFLHYRQLRIDLRTLGLRGISKEESDAAVKKVIESIADFESVAAAYEAKNTQPSAEEAALYAKVKSNWVNFKKVGERVLIHYKAGTEEDHRQMTEIFLHDCPEEAKIFRASIEAFSEFQRKQVDQLTILAASDAASAKNSIIITSILSLLCGIVMSIFSSRSAASLVSQIEGFIVKLSSESDHVSSVSENVAGASQTLSAGATQQAAAIQETTVALEETSAMVSKNAENAKQSKEIAYRSQASAGKGKESVTDVLSAIEEIANSNADIARQITESNKEMGEVVKVIQEIGSKTKVINDIVFQTKLLSFNASVEAARAGEQGKGFAVVAEEVGNLAQMSGNSAKEITELLEQSTARVEDMVAKTKSKVDKLLEDSHAKVRAGVEKAKRCDGILSEIVDDVGSVGNLVSEIAVASQEQSNGVAEVNKAIAELDAAAQQNSQASNQVATGADDLKNQVVRMRGFIEEMIALLGKGPRAAVNKSVTVEKQTIVPKKKLSVVKESEPVKEIQSLKNVIPLKSISKTAKTKMAVGDSIPSHDSPGFD